MVYAIRDNRSLITTHLPFAPVHIMWTRATTSPPLHGWTPNHFVPLMIEPDAQQKSVSECLSYTEVVTRGKKRLQKFFYLREEKNRENVEIHTSSRISRNEGR